MTPYERQVWAAVLSDIGNIWTGKGSQGLVAGVYENHMKRKQLEEDSRLRQLSLMNQMQNDQDNRYHREWQRNEASKKEANRSEAFSLLMGGEGGEGPSIFDPDPTRRSLALANAAALDPDRYTNSLLSSLDGGVEDEFKYKEREVPVPGGKMFKEYSEDGGRTWYPLHEGTVNRWEPSSGTERGRAFNAYYDAQRKLQAGIELTPEEQRAYLNSKNFFETPQLRRGPDGEVLSIKPGYPNVQLMDEMSPQQQQEGIFNEPPPGGTKLSMDVLDTKDNNREESRTLLKQRIGEIRDMVRGPQGRFLAGPLGWAAANTQGLRSLGVPVPLEPKLLDNKLGQVQFLLAPLLAKESRLSDPERKRVEDIVGKLDPLKSDAMTIDMAMDEVDELIDIYYPKTGIKPVEGLGITDVGGRKVYQLQTDADYDRVPEGAEFIPPGSTQVRKKRNRK